MRIQVGEGRVDGREEPVKVVQVRTADRVAFEFLLDDRQAAELSAALGETDLTRLLNRVRVVAEHWREEGIKTGASWSHPCAVILAALDGEDDPAKLGVTPGSPAAIALDNLRFVERVDQPASTNSGPAAD